MGNISKNLSRYEMACECTCGFAACDIELVNLLQEVTDYFTLEYKQQGRVILEITGPNRCVPRNEQVQSEYYARRGETYQAYSSRSFHTKGMAADFKLWIKEDSGVLVQIPAKLIYSYIDFEYPFKYGMGLYSDRVHLDSRSTRSRWDET